MKIKTENLALCADCTLIAELGVKATDLADTDPDTGFLAYIRQFHHLVPTSLAPNPFSREMCACCNSTLAGERHYYSELEEGEP